MAMAKPPIKQETQMTPVAGGTMVGVDTDGEGGGRGATGGATGFSLDSAWGQIVLGTAAGAFDPAVKSMRSSPT